MAEKENEMLTVKEVSNTLRMGTLTVYKLIHSEVLPAYKIGRQWRIRRGDLNAYIESQRTKPGQTTRSKKESPVKQASSEAESQPKGGEENAR